MGCLFLNWCGKNGAKLGVNKEWEGEAKRKVSSGWGKEWTKAASMADGWLMAMAPAGDGLEGRQLPIMQIV
jgi:hypothetical protein